MGEDDDSLDMELGLSFKGLGAAKEYERVLTKIVQQHKELDATIRSARGQQFGASAVKMAEAAMSSAQRATGTSYGAPSGARGSGGGASGQSAPTDMKKLNEATRGAAVSLDKLKFVGNWTLEGFKLMAKGLASAFGAVVALTLPGALASDKYVSARATSGGSVADAARQDAMGGSPEAARAFQERITSDPRAMSAAARIGIHNLPGVYGDKNWTKQYLTAIERTSKIGDANVRRDLEIWLGIGQEVEKYSLLSSATKQKIKEAADISASFNDPKTQAQSQELLTAMKLQKQAVENLGMSFSNLLGEDVTGIMEEVSKGVNEAARFVKAVKDPLRKFLGNDDKRYDTGLGALTHGRLGDEGFRPEEEANTQTWYARADMHKKFRTPMGMWSGGRWPGDPGVETTENLWSHHLKAYRQAQDIKSSMNETQAAAQKARSFDPGSSATWKGGMVPAQGAGDTTAAPRTLKTSINIPEMARLTDALNRLIGIYGGGPNTREALPSPLQGQQLHEAIMSRSLRIGALG